MERRTARLGSIPTPETRISSITWSPEAERYYEGRRRRIMVVRRPRPIIWPFVLALMSAALLILGTVGAPLLEFWLSTPPRV